MFLPQSSVFAVTDQSPLSKQKRESMCRYSYLVLLISVVPTLTKDRALKAPESSDLNCEAFSGGLSSDALEQIAQRWVSCFEEGKGKIANNNTLFFVRGSTWIRCCLEILYRQCNLKRKHDGGITEPHSMRKSYERKMLYCIFLEKQVKKLPTQCALLEFTWNSMEHCMKAKKINGSELGVCSIHQF